MTLCTLKHGRGATRGQSGPRGLDQFRSFRDDLARPYLTVDNWIAIVPDGLPPGHAGYGKPVGSRYRIDFYRWPGRWLVFDQLPLAGQISPILNHDDFVGVHQAVDLLPEIAVSQVPEAKQALAALALKIPTTPTSSSSWPSPAPPTLGTPNPSSPRSCRTNHPATHWPATSHANMHRSPENPRLRRLVAQGGRRPEPAACP